MKTKRIAVGGLHKCGNCGKIHDAIDLGDMEDLHERVEAGNSVPSGECPDCGALCYPYTKRLVRKDSTIYSKYEGDILGAIDGVFGNNWWGKLSEGTQESIHDVLYRVLNVKL